VYLDTGQRREPASTRQRGRRNAGVASRPGQTLESMDTASNYRGQVTFRNLVGITRITREYSETIRSAVQFIAASISRYLTK